MSNRDWLSDASVGRWLIVVALVALFSGMPVSFALIGAGWPFTSNPLHQDRKTETQNKPAPESYSEEAKNERDAAFWRDADGSAKTYRAICDKPQDHDAADLCQQWRSANYAQVQMWVGLFTLIGLAVTVGFTIRGFGLNRRATEAAVEATRIAEAGMVAGERAFIYAKGFHQFFDEDPQGLKYWRFRPLWHNSGNTPTKHMTMYSQCEVRSSSLPAGFEHTHDEKNVGVAFIAPKTSTMGGLAPTITERPITPQDIADVIAGRKTLYLWGWAKYWDVFPETAQHITRFCWIITPSGDPTIPGAQIDFPYVHNSVGNCADDECDQPQT